MIHGEPMTSAQIKVTFTFAPVGGVDDQQQVSVVGDFNDWHPFATLFNRRTDGSLEASAVVYARQRFAFRYLAQDGQWLNDDATPFEPNEIGGVNSVCDPLVVLATAATARHSPTRACGVPAKSRSRAKRTKA